MTFNTWALIAIAALLGLMIVCGVFARPLLPVSRAIDAVNLRIGKLMIWLVLLAVLVSAINAVVRKIWSSSSNAWLEVQWYMFAGIVMLCASYTLLRNEHVRIDVFTGRFSRRALAKIDIFGLLVFLLPMTCILLWLSWPLFANSVIRSTAGSTTHSIAEVIAGLFDPSGWTLSDQAGGLVRWPALILIPLGFLMLSLQGVSELIKRFAFLKGLIPDPNEKHAAHGTE